MIHDQRNKQQQKIIYMSLFVSYLLQLYPLLINYERSDVDNQAKVYIISKPNYHINFTISVAQGYTDISQYSCS